MTDSTLLDREAVEPSGPARGADMTVVIPAFNEADAIGGTLASLKAALPAAEIVVVDDGSSDGTAAEAMRVSDVQVIRHGFNLGYGAALKTGMRQAGRRYIGWFDADNEHRVEDLAAMLDAIHARNLAAVIGQRPRVATTATRTIGKFVIRMVAATLGLRVGHDLNCGLRVFRREAILPYLSLLPDSYSASTTSTMIMAERGYPVSFHAIRTNQRIGRSKVRLAHGFATMAIVLRTIMLFAPLRIFLGLGLPIIGLGLLYSLVMAAIVGQGLPGAGLLAMLAGLLFCAVGLLADQISQLRLFQLRQVGDASRPAAAGHRSADE